MQFLGLMVWPACQVCSLASAPLLSATREGLHRKLAKPVVKKQPVSATLLQKMVQSLGHAPSLSDKCQAGVGCPVGFCRFSEV